jgi:hypothetical protein
MAETAMLDQGKPVPLPRGLTFPINNLARKAHQLPAGPLFVEDAA